MGYFVLAMLTAIALVTGWRFVSQADREMRAEVLQRAQLVAGAIDARNVRSLARTEADLANPAYQRLVAQLAAVREADARCRFIYLMGRDAEGHVIFLVDAQDDLTEQEPPAKPGDLYDDASPELVALFDNEQAFVEGPLPDQWGVWVSALVPIPSLDVDTGRAVLGMDFDARQWKWEVAARATPPLVAVFALLIVLSATVVLGNHLPSVPRPVLWRLFPPVAGMTLLLVTGAGAMLWQQQRQRLDDAMACRVREVSADLKMAMELQADGLATALRPVAADAGVQTGLRDRDRERLLADWLPVFERFKQKELVSHFYFIDANRDCLLRLHEPARAGDRIARFTLMEAQRTGETASGVELGTLGTFTLRVVQPVYCEGKLVGYIEFGKEIEEILQRLHEQSGGELAVAIRKEHLVRESWEAGMRVLGRDADWDRLPNSVVAYASQGKLPDEFANWVDAAEREGRLQQGADKQIACNDKVWCVSEIPLMDVVGKAVGNVLLMCDVTTEKADFARMMTVAAAGGGLLYFGLACFVLSLLRRTDAVVLAQQVELRSNEALLASTLRSIGDGVIACDKGGNVISVNVAGEYLTGWSNADALGRPISDVFRIVHARSRRGAEIPVGRVLRENRHVGLADHTVLIARDGTERHIADSCAPIHNADGEVVGAVLVFRDVTEEHARQQELSEERKRIDHVLAITKAGIDIIDSQFNLRYVDVGLRKVYGEPKGRKCYEYFMGCAGPCDGCGVPQALETHLPIVTERLLPRENNRITQVHSIPFQDAAGEWLVAQFNVDITQRKLAEAAVLEQTRLLQTILDGVPDVIMLHDTDRRIISLNKAGCAWLGVSADEARGRNCHEMLGCTEPCRGCSAGPTNSWEKIVSTKRLIPELQKWVRTTSIPIKDESGRTRLVVEQIQDITKPELAHRRLNETVAALESANKALEEYNRLADSAVRAKSEFLANMSHEIRTPMTAILGFADLLLEDTDVDHSPPARVEAIRTIQRNGQHLLELINDILDLSKIEAGKVEIERVTCSPVHILRDVIALMRVRADAKGLPVTIEYASSIPEWIQSDPLRIRQVVINLIGNAIKFTETGSVHVVAHLKERMEGPPLLQVDIIDTGIGLSEEQISRLFVPFGQADSSTTRKYGGTGLGLTISKRLAEVLGGDISIKSTPGRGSTFSVTFATGQLEGVRLLDPSAARGLPSSQEAATPSTQMARLQHRVLLAEDGPDNQRIVTFILKKAGAHVTLVENGERACDEALTALSRQEPFDVILMDMQMPVMDGYEATRRLRSLGYTGRIIALTAHALEGDEAKCLSAGCDGYLTKPIERAKLLRTIAESAPITPLLS